MPEPARSFLPATMQHFRIEAPQRLAGSRIDGVHDAVTGGDVKDAVDRERSCLRIAHVEIECPRQLEAPDGLAIDFSQRAVVRLAGGAADGRPVAGIERRR